MPTQSNGKGRRRAVLYTAYACLVAVLVSAAMIIVGDPIWNLYFIALAWIVGIPVGVGCAAWLIWTGKQAPASS